IVYGTTTGIGNSVVGARCESACGADFDCDEQLENLFIPAAPCDGQRKGYCGIDSACDYDKVCNQATCGASAECNVKKVGDACIIAGNPGFCDASCACVASCDNDNVQEGLEQCDGIDLDGQTCATKGFTAGTLACNADCTFNTSGCNACSGAVSDGMCPPGCNLTPGPTYDIDCGEWNCATGTPNEALDCVTFATGGSCLSFDNTSCGGPNVWNCSGNCDAPAYRNPPGNCSVFTESRQKACGCTCGPPPATCGPADGDCPGGCSNPPDPDCPPTCVVTEASEVTCNDGLDNDCDGQADCADVGGCPNGTLCSGTNFCDTGSCVECTISNLSNCATDEVCNLGSCSPCKGEGDAASGISQCCKGLNWIDGFCTSRCDPRTGFFCNPLRQTVEDIIQGGQKLIGYVLGLIGSIALLFIIIAGMMYMTSAGNEEKIASSKRILTGSIIGIAITLLAYSFLQVILSILNM
ncbi:MAG: pilin, partial [Minisyncoccia bacterium]